MGKNKKIAILAIMAIIIVITVIVFIISQNKNEIYTVSFNTDGGELVSSQQVKDGEKVSKPTNPTKEGYKFLGWYLGDEIFNFTTPIKENINLQAKWEKVNETAYTITLENDGEKTVLKTDEHGILKEPEAPTKEGYKFLGWYIGEEKVDFAKPFTKDSRIVAKWEKEDETVKEDENVKEDKTSTDKTENKKPTTPEQPTTPEEPATPEKPTTPEEPVTPEEPTTPNKPVTPTQYKVMFDSNGGSSNPTTQIVNKGEKATMPSNPIREGYTFVAWQLNGQDYDFSKEINENISLTAKWEKNPDTYTAKLVPYSMQTPEIGAIKIFKNGGTTPITFIELQNSSGSYIGKYNAEDEGMRNANQFVFNSLAKVKLSDGTVVNVQNK